jgi:protein-S-isoprenylcysteine O-methyltransferase Ste14
MLGTNWSADVTVKHDHELIEAGPYAYSRHPIYTGLVLALFGTALAVGETRALIAFVIALASLWYKMGLEERVMRRTFGAAYDAYTRRVKALIPFVV